MTLSDYLKELGVEIPGEHDGAWFMEFLYNLVAEDDRKFDDSTLRYFSTKAASKLRETEKQDGDQRRAVEGNGGKTGSAPKRRARKT